MLNFPSLDFLVVSETTEWEFEKKIILYPKVADNTDAETIKQYDAGLLMHLDRSCYKKAKAFVAQWFLASIFFANTFILLWLCYFLSAYILTEICFQ